MRGISVDPRYLSQLIQQHQAMTRDRNDWRSATFIVFGALVVVIGVWLA